MDILISFCNTLVLPGYPSLGILNPDMMDFKVVELPPEVPQTGVLGIAQSSKYIFLGLQHSFDATKAYRLPTDIGLQYSHDGKMAYENPPALLIFDRITFKLITNYTFQLVRDIHSFHLTKDKQTLFVVSTGTDELIEVQLKDNKVLSEKVFWRPDPNGERSDNYHLNSIYEWKGDLYISGFGKKADHSQNWTSALDGFIYNITRGEKIASQLEHPHSILSFNGEMAICESRKKRLRFVGSKETVDLQSYARGLCIYSDKLFIGTSARRIKSKSTGKLVEQDGKEEVGCTISRVSGENLEIEKTIILNDYANEIYELMPIDDTSLWPVREPINYRQQFTDAWNMQAEKALKEMQDIIPHGETLILVDDSSWESNLRNLSSIRRLHFLERDGLYWGLPHTPETATIELERMRQEQNAGYIAFGWPCFWWLKANADFQNYLEKNYECVIENERIIGFDLKERQ